MSGDDESSPEPASGRRQVIGVPHATPGMFVTFDGPDGVGKSTIIDEVATQLKADGIPVHLTCEPTQTDMGRLIRHGVDDYRGLALAHFVAGDRYFHCQSEVLPSLERGEVVLSHRYVPSSLVLQRIDDISIDLLIQMNSEVLRPDATVILAADVQVILTRLGERTSRNRFESASACATQMRLYREAAGVLRGYGWNVIVVDTTQTPPCKIAESIIEAAGVRGSE